MSPPTDALAKWKDFPAGQVPRPIVLLTNRSGPSSYSSLEARNAALCGRFALGGQLPTLAPNGASATWADGTTATYPAISAQDAYSAIKHNSPGGSSPACATATPLSVSSVRFGLSRFQTDRGTADLSSWTFMVAGAEGGIGYPAFAPSAFWGGGLSQASIGGAASVSQSGRVITFSFIGAPPDGPCAQDYTSVVAESLHAVAVALQSFPGRVVGGPNDCPLVSSTRSVTVNLASPLGGRVLIDASGAPVPVCPEEFRLGC